MKHSPKMLDKVFWGAYTRYGEPQDKTGAERARVENVLRRLEEFGAHPPQSVFDAGCNTGTYTLALALAGYETTGVDFAPGLLNAARRRAEELKVPATFGKMDLDKVFWYDDSEFDNAICTSVLHAVRRPEWVLDELRRVIKPGGLLLLTLWLDQAKHREAFPQLFAKPENEPDAGMATRFRRAVKTLSEPQRRLRYWTPAEMRQMLESRNFEILRLDGDPLLTVVARGQ
jgi:ubiquinone/menaquinone biosynthesis C-methylase UbiE